MRRKSMMGARIVEEHAEISARASARISADSSPPVLNREQMMGLRASDFQGVLHTFVAVGLTVLAFWSSWHRSLGLWFVGQIIFAVAFIKWFTLLHEAGHQTLFASRLGNGVAGRLAAFFSILPYSSWKAIHRLHHKWTGWQDIDPTTTSLVPRTLGPFERHAIRIAWAFWLPLFSVLYRLQSFWHVPRLFKLFGDPQTRRSLLVDMGGLVILYGLTIFWLGPWEALRLVGLGYFLGFAAMDVIMLSQHTHIPLELSHGAEVKPIPAPEQAPYTRSLLFAPWLSKTILSGFDAHELHHVYPFVPGPRLREIPWTPPNEVPGFAWTRAAKAVPADDFLFKNRKTSGLSV